MAKLDNFGPVYLINLPDQIERSQHMKKQFAKNNITDYTMIHAVDGRTSDLREIVYGKYPKLRSAEIGCIASHVKAIQTWLDTSDSEYAIIMEDDCSFDNVKHWQWDWNYFMANVPEDADIVQLVMLKEDNVKFNMHRKDRYNPSDFFSYSWSTACYLIKRSYAKKLISKLVVDGKIRSFEGKYKDKPADVILYNLGNAYSMPILTHFVDTKNAINLGHQKFHNRSKKYIDGWWQNYSQKYTKESFFDVDNGLRHANLKGLDLVFKIFHIDGDSEILKKRSILTKRATDTLLLDFDILDTPTVMIQDANGVRDFFADKPIKFDPAGWNGRGWKIGEFGIWASNFTAWQNFAKTDHEMLMLIEDDIVLEKNFNEKLIAYINELPEDWDFFTVYMPPTGNDRYKKDKASFHIDRENVCKVYQSWSCLCYVVSKNGVKKLLKQVSENVHGPIDHWLFYNKELNGYAIKLEKENICNIYKMPSTVQSNSYRNMADYV